MCIPGHSRDSVCLHCHPARLTRSGTRQGIAPGNRCAEPCPTKRPQPRQEPWPLRPVADAAGIGKPGWRPPAPRAHRGSPGPAPTRCCRRPRSMRRRENVRTRPPGFGGGQKPGGHQHRRRRVPPTPKGSTSRTCASASTPHAASAVGSARPGRPRDPAGRHAPPRAPAHRQLGFHGPGDPVPR